MRKYRHFVPKAGSGKLGQGVSRSLKFGAEVRNCIWRCVLCLNKCIYL